MTGSFLRNIGRLLTSGITLIFCLVVLFGCAETEHTEAITAEITAAQIEGRRAGAQIAAPEWKDTTKLKNALLEAKAKQSKYLIDGKPQCAEAFDSAFVSTIRTINPKLAKKIVP